MIKDTFFSLPRFMNLCRKEMVENWRSNVLRMVLMYGVMAVVMVWNGYFEYRYWHSGQIEDPAWTFLLVVFIWSLWGFCCLSASFTMEKMKTKTSRTSMLMVPATPFEKFFSRWFVFTVVFLVIFLINWRIIHVLLSILWLIRRRRTLSFLSTCRIWLEKERLIIHYVGPGYNLEPCYQPISLCNPYSY